MKQVGVPRIRCSLQGYTPCLSDFSRCDRTPGKISLRREVYSGAQLRGHSHHGRGDMEANTGLAVAPEL